MKISVQTNIFWPQRVLWDYCIAYISAERMFLAYEMFCGQFSPIAIIDFDAGKTFDTIL